MTVVATENIQMEQQRSYRLWAKGSGNAGAALTGGRRERQYLSAESLGDQGRQTESDDRLAGLHQRCGQGADLVCMCRSAVGRGIVLEAHRDGVQSARAFRQLTAERKA